MTQTRVFRHGEEYALRLAPRINVVGGKEQITSVVSSAFVPIQNEWGKWKLLFAFRVYVTTLTREGISFEILGFPIEGTAENRKL